MTGTRLPQCVFAVVLAVLAVPLCQYRAAAQGDGAPPPVRVLVVTGDHPYDYDAFMSIWQGHDDMEFAFVELVDKGEIFDSVADWNHDVMVLYNMSNPMSEDPATAQRRYANFINILERGVGLIPMHHGLLTYMEWPEAREIYGCHVGADGPFGFHLDQHFTVQVADPDHPITEGIQDYPFVDETYTNWYGAERPDNHILLTTDHDLADPPIAWVRRYRNARVFSFQSGHDAAAFTHETFRLLMARGIRWAAGRLPWDAGGEALANTTIFRKHNKDYEYRALVRYQRGEDRGALDIIEDRVREAQADRRASTALAERLARLLAEDCSADGKRFIFRQLAMLRDPAQVPVIASFLTDPDWSDCARLALEPIPGRAADRALRDALAITGGTARTGIINSLGNRRAARAAPALAELAASGDEQTARAAVDALGAIATPGAERALARLEPSRALLHRVQEARMRCADAWLGEARTRAAGRVYADVWAAPATPMTAGQALAGLLRARGEDARHLLLESLSSNDAAVRHAALACMNQLSSEQTTHAVAALLPELPVETRAQVLSKLAERDDPAALPQVRVQAEAGDAHVRRAAIEALAVLGTAEDVPLLLRQAAGEGETAQAGRWSLARLKGEDVDARLIGFLQNGSVGEKETVARVLAERLAAIALEPLLAATEHGTADVRAAAFEALGVLATGQFYPSIVARAATLEHEDDVDAALNALVAAAERLDDGERLAPAIIEVASDSTPQARVAFVQLLGHMPCDASLGFLREQLAADSRDARAAAIAGLADWPDPRPREDLLRAARDEGAPELRAEALEGFIEHTARGGDVSEDAKVAMLAEALDIAENPRTLRKALQSLGELHRIEALRLAAGFAGHPDGGGAAVDTALALAGALTMDYPDEVDQCLGTLETAIQEGGRRGQVARLREQAREFGGRLRAQWSFREGAEGWEAANHCEIEVVDEVLRIHITGHDPFIIAPSAVAAGDYIVAIRARFERGGYSQLFWTTTRKPEFVLDSPVATFPVEHNDGRWTEYEVPITTDAAMTQLRFDPFGDTGTVEVDWVRTLAAGGQAP